MWRNEYLQEKAKTPREEDSSRKKRRVGKSERIVREKERRGEYPPIFIRNARGFFSDVKVYLVPRERERKRYARATLVNFKTRAARRGDARMRAHAEGARAALSAYADVGLTVA